MVTNRRRISIGLLLLGCGVHSFPIVALADVGPVRSPMAVTTPVAPAATSPLPRAARLPKFGLMVDAGLPEGVIAALVLRPMSWLRLHGGGGSNGAASTVRAGLSLLPLGAGPSLHAEVGHQAKGDVNGLARRLVWQNFADSDLLRNVNMDYVNLHGGLDFGVERVVFFIHFGASLVWATLHDVGDIVDHKVAISAAAANAETVVTVASDPTFRATVVSIKLGLIVYLD